MIQKHKNPHHPLTSFMREEWAKIVALIMHREGWSETTITERDLEAFRYSGRCNVAIRFRDGVGIELYLVDDKEAERLARQAGGRPL